ncbi:MAG TPA: cytochrome c oxidase subunit 3 [Anaerolineaceae bacterium]
MNQASTQPRGTGLDTAKVATIVILGSETFFFGTLVSAYLFMRGMYPWPLEGAPLSRLAVPTANSFILLISVITMALALRAVRANQRAGLVAWSTVTLLLGLVFVGGQIFEYTSNGMLPNDSGFGGVFLTLMGFHALHLLAGVVFLGVIVMRARLGDFSAKRHSIVEVGAWFWYYVAAVWAALYTVLYLV